MTLDAEWSGLPLSDNHHAVFDKRVDASDGQLQRAMNKRGPITNAFRDAVYSNHEGFLETIYAAKEVMAFKRVLKALTADPSDPCAAELLNRLQWDDIKDRTDSPVCPLARHTKSLELQLAAMDFVFPCVIGELALVTIVHDYAPHLIALEDTVTEALGMLKVVRQTMSKEKRGYLEFGAFEPDLKSADDILEGKSLGLAAQQLGWEVGDGGGYVLSSHRIVRVVDLNRYRKLLRKVFPAKAWDRVQVKSLKRNKDLWQSVYDVLRYITKWSPHVEAIRKVTCPKVIRTVFLGPTTDRRIRKVYDSDFSIRQYALFLDRMGFNNLLINHVNSFAHRWCGEEELDFFSKEGLYENLHGYYSREVFRPKLVDSMHYKKATPEQRKMMTPPRKPTKLIIPRNNLAPKSMPRVVNVRAGGRAISIPLG